VSPVLCFFQAPPHDLQTSQKSVISFFMLKLSAVISEMIILEVDWRPCAMHPKITSDRSGPYLWYHYVYLWAESGASRPVINPPPSLERLLLLIYHLAPYLLMFSIPWRARVPYQYGHKTYRNQC